MNMKTLFIFVLAITSLVGCSGSKAQVENKNLVTENSKTENNISPENKNLKVESADEKAVRVAEEFIKRNGYTDAPADKNNLSHETVEFYENIDELLESRQNSLELKAYGFLRKGRSSEKGWTVIFRHNETKYKDIADKYHKNSGRAVTMDENFENLLVEHKNIFLEAAEVKLEK